MIKIVLCLQHVRGVIQAGRWVIFIVSVAKTELLEEMLRSMIMGIVAGKESIRLKGVEGIANYRDSSLPGIAPAPLL